MPYGIGYRRRRTGTTGAAKTKAEEMMEKRHNEIMKSRSGAAITPAEMAALEKSQKRKGRRR